MRRRHAIDWTPGRKWAAGGMAALLMFGLVLRTGRVAASLIFLTLAAALVVVGITVDKRWR